MLPVSERRRSASAMSTRPHTHASVKLKQDGGETKNNLENMNSIGREDGEWVWVKVPN